MVVAHFSDFINLLEKKSWVFKNIGKRSNIKLKCVDYFFTKWQLYGYKKNISWNSSKIWWIMGWPLTQPPFTNFVIAFNWLLNPVVFAWVTVFEIKKFWKYNVTYIWIWIFLFSVYLNRLLYMFILKKKNYSA